MSKKNNLDKDFLSVYCKEVEKYIKPDPSANMLYYHTIILPSVNMYINCMYGAFMSDNKYPALMSIRGMIEAIAAIAFFEYKDPQFNFFNSYLKEGRIDFDNGKKENSIRKQIGCIDSLLNISGTLEYYDYLCCFVHFGEKQISTVVRDYSYSDDGDASFYCCVQISPIDEEQKKLICGMIKDIQKIACGVLKYYYIHRMDNSNRFKYCISKKTGEQLKKYIKINN